MVDFLNHLSVWQLIFAPRPSTFLPSVLLPSYPHSQPRGFAFVEFLDRRDAEVAREKMVLTTISHEKKKK